MYKNIKILTIILGGGRKRNEQTEDIIMNFDDVPWLLTIYFYTVKFDYCKTILYDVYRVFFAHRLHFVTVPVIVLKKYKLTNVI